jgi:hypothetical protein
MVRLLKRLIALIPWGVLVASLIGFAGKDSRWFDHFSSFRMHIAAECGIFDLFFNKTTAHRNGKSALEVY